MRIVLISDTHSLHKDMLYKLPKGDLLLLAGDCTNVGKDHEVRSFIRWFESLEDFETKIFIAGNHDWAFEKKPDWLSDYVKNSNCIYLEDEEYVITDPEFSKPIKIYGSPWQPWFYDWAFNLPRNGEELEKRWKAIPDDTKILITHGPPFGYLDITPQNIRVGCEVLAFRVEQLKPLIHMFGHIHHSYGIIDRNGTTFVNASICNERYQPINKPIVIDLIEIDGELVVSVIDGGD